MVEEIKATIGGFSGLVGVHKEAAISIGVKGKVLSAQYADLVFEYPDSMLVIDLYFTTLGTKDLAFAKLRSLRFLGYAGPLAAFRGKQRVCVAAIVFRKPVLYAAEYAYTWAKGGGSGMIAAGGVVATVPKVEYGEWMKGHFVGGGVVYAEGIERGDHLVGLYSLCVGHGEEWYDYGSVVAALRGGVLYLVSELDGYGDSGGVSTKLRCGVRLLGFRLYFSRKGRVAGDIGPDGERSHFTRPVYVGSLGPKVGAEKVGEDVVHE
jgi:hypothetical protein